MKKLLIATSLLAAAAAFTGCSSKSAAPAPTNTAQAAPAAAAQTTTPDNAEINEAGHNVLLQFYSFYALKDEQGLNDWLNLEFVHPDQQKESFKKIFSPGTYTNVAVEFSGFKATPVQKDQWNVSADIKLHLINKPNNKEDLFNKHISVTMQKDEKTQDYKILSFEESAK